jgi:hypothetical protein
MISGTFARRFLEPDHLEFSLVSSRHFECFLYIWFNVGKLECREHSYKLIIPQLSIGNEIDVMNGKILTLLSSSTFNTTYSGAELHPPLMWHQHPAVMFFLSNIAIIFLAVLTDSI